MTILKKVEVYAIKSEEKRENFNLLLKRGELEKAGEILWGAIVNLIDAIRIAKGAPLKNHGKMRKFFESYSVNKQNPELWDLFKETEKLHPNFYHSFMDKEYFDETCEAALKLHDKLKILIYEEMEKLKT